MSHDDGVKPAAAALPARGGTEFMTHRAHVFARLIVQFRWHGAVTDTGDVGLGDADDVLHMPRVDACTVGGVAPRGDGGGDEGEGALVNVQKTALCAFEDDMLTEFEGVVEHQAGVGDALGVIVVNPCNVGGESVG